DLKTGLIVPNPDKATHAGQVVRDICPAAPGLKDWNPSAFSPLTGLVYIPHNNLCMDYGAMQANYISGTPYVGAAVKMYPGAGVGGWAGAIVSAKMDPRDPTGALGFVNAVKDLPQKTTAGGILYVFTLPR